MINTAQYTFPTLQLKNPSCHLPRPGKKSLRHPQQKPYTKDDIAEMTLYEYTGAMDSQKPSLDTSRQLLNNPSNPPLDTAFPCSHLPQEGNRSSPYRMLKHFERTQQNNMDHLKMKEPSDHVYMTQPLSSCHGSSSYTPVCKNTTPKNVNTTESFIVEGSALAVDQEKGLTSLNGAKHIDENGNRSVRKEINLINKLKPRSDLTKTRLCENYIKGLCHDPKCKWAHGRHELRFTDEFYKTSLCKYWLNSVCYAGVMCRHAHGNDELRERKSPLGTAMKIGNRVNMGDGSKFVGCSTETRTIQSPSTFYQGNQNFFFEKQGSTSVCHFIHKHCLDSHGNFSSAPQGNQSLEKQLDHLTVKGLTTGEYHSGGKELKQSPKENGCVSDYQSQEYNLNDFEKRCSSNYIHSQQILATGGEDLNAKFHSNTVVQEEAFQDSVHPTDSTFPAWPAYSNLPLDTVSPNLEDNKEYTTPSHITTGHDTETFKDKLNENHYYTSDIARRHTLSTCLEWDPLTSQRTGLDLSLSSTMQTNERFTEFFKRFSVDDITNWLSQKNQDLPSDQLFFSQTTHQDTFNQNLLGDKSDKADFFLQLMNYQPQETLDSLALHSTDARYTMTQCASQNSMEVLLQNSMDQLCRTSSDETDLTIQVAQEKKKEIRKPLSSFSQVYENEESFPKLSQYKENSSPTRPSDSRFTHTISDLNSSPFASMKCDKTQGQKLNLCFSSMINNMDFENEVLSPNIQKENSVSNVGSAFIFPETGALQTTITNEGVTPETFLPVNDVSFSTDDDSLSATLKKRYTIGIPSDQEYKDISFLSQLWKDKSHDNLTGRESVLSHGDGSPDVYAPLQNLLPPSYVMHMQDSTR